jgi:hypothetical protein
MAGKKRPVLDGKTIAKAIADDLPGWKLARKRSVADGVAAEAAVGAQPGATLKDLRKKFLGSEADADSDAVTGGGPEDYGTLEENRTTVRVEPTDGGPAKVADIVDGKAKIVQG